MPADGKWQTVCPKSNQPVGVFFPVLINAQVNAGSQRIDVLRNPAGRIKSFSICQVIHQLYKFLSHFIGIGGSAMLHFFPAVFIFFYK